MLKHTRFLTVGSPSRQIACMVRYACKDYATCWVCCRFLYVHQAGCLSVCMRLEPHVLTCAIWAHQIVRHRGCSHDAQQPNLSSATAKPGTTLSQV